MSLAAEQWRSKALAARAAGDTAGAEAAFAQGIAAFPGNAALLNSAGSFLSQEGRHDEALARYEAALGADSRHAEAFLNRAIVLSRLGRAAEAMDDMSAREHDFGTLPRYWSVRATTARDLGRLDEAARCYDALLLREAGHARGLHGRARVALERGERDMCERFERALPHNRADATAFLGYAQALACSGRTQEALALAETLVAQLPAWTDALAFLAQLRWAAGDAASFCDHFATAMARVPQDPAIPLAWATALAGTDRYAEAADVLARARSLLPDDQALLLAEAEHAGAAGDLARAERLFENLALHDSQRKLQEARLRLRQRAPDRADALLAQVIARDPDTIAAWALRDLAWRMMDDPRVQWLHGQPGLFSQRPLGLDADTLAVVVALLRDLHVRSLPPVGQSVRSGSQTWGGLFDRMEPELRRLQEAIADLIAAHRAGLPPADAAHPLLRHRDTAWHVRGSWSIRMLGQGRHTEHIHPQGVLSSAAHLVVPPDAGIDDAGCLELGRSPPDLRIDLPPIATITPVAGSAVLFPSTLYHGTRPFGAGERMSVAFDVAAGARAH